jgi:hypothetical protein
VGAWTRRGRAAAAVVWETRPGGGARGEGDMGRRGPGYPEGSREGADPGLGRRVQGPLCPLPFQGFWTLPTPREGQDRCPGLAFQVQLSDLEGSRNPVGNLKSATWRLEDTLGGTVGSGPPEA